MYEKLKEHLDKVPGGVQNNWGETLWPLSSVSIILEMALEHNWMVLGGDVLTPECKYTYDNWFFEPDPQKPLKTNVEGGVEKSRQYISQYIAAHGADFLFALSISNKYVEGCGGGLCKPF